MAYRMLIDGELIEGTGTIDVVNPATGRSFQKCPRADATLLNKAVAAAKRAYPSWSALGYDQRRAKVEALADALAARQDEFARLLTQEQGKPLPLAHAEVAASVLGLRSYAAMRVESKVLRETAEGRIVQIRGPLGVVGAITPWNFPLQLLIMKIGPALITGNCVVAKPAPTTPLTTLLMGEIAASILPRGVLNVIVDENDLGAQLTQHPDIAKISFTGSTATGKRVMASAAGTLKRLTLELGGNDGALVLDDADVQQVAPAIFQAAMLNSGQICLAAKRIYVHSSLYEAMAEQLAKLAQQAVVDDGLKPGTTIGPIQNKTQFEKVKGYLELAHATGRVIAGGHALDRDGYFIAPTIVRDIADDSPLVCEEQFGPVLPLLRYDDLDSVIERINATEYGLGGTLWTANAERGFEIATRINAGTVWINKWLDLPYEVPMRGAKQSGMGAENGQDGLEEYTQARIINMAL